MKISKILLLVIVSIVLPCIKFNSGFLDSELIGDGNDNLLNLTIFEKNISNFQSVLNGANLLTLYTSNSFYPYKYTSLFTESLYFPSLFYFLAKLIFRNESLAYNSLFIFSSLLNFFSFYYLSKTLKFTFSLALLGSLLYSGGHFFSIQYVHIQNQFAFGFPLIFAFIYRYYESRNSNYLVFIYLTLTLQFFTCTYFGLYSLYFSFLAYGIIIFLNIPSKNQFFTELKTKFQIKPFLYFATSILFFVITVFMIYGWFLIQNNELYPKRGLLENSFYSNTIHSILRIQDSIYRIHKISFNGVTHNSVHIGYTLLVFIIISLWIKRKIKIQVGLFLILSLLFYIFSLGPNIDFYGFELKGPYGILFHLFPGFKNLRVPSRIFVVSWFFLVLFFVFYLSSIQWKKTAKLQIMLGILFLLEFYGLVSIRETSAVPQSFTSNHLDLPENSNIVFVSMESNQFKLSNEPFPEWYLLNTKIKTPNGYSGLTLPFQYYLDNLIYHHFPNTELMAYLSELGFSHIAIMDAKKSKRSLVGDFKLQNSKSIEFIFSDRTNGLSLYKIKAKPNSLSAATIKNQFLTPVNYAILDSSVSKRQNLLNDKKPNPLWQSFSEGIQSEADFIRLQLASKIRNSLVIRLSAGPYLERLPYGVDLLCGTKRTVFALPKIDIPTLLTDPTGIQYMYLRLDDCKAETIELRVGKTTPYAILMLGELEVFNYNPQ